MNMNDAYPGFNPETMRLFQSQLPVKDIEMHGLRKAGDPESRKVVYRVQTHVDLFDLEDTTQRQRYNEILQMAADGKVRIIDTEIKTHPTTGNFRALVHWADSVLMPPGADGVIVDPPTAPAPAAEEPSHAG
jgi:hypothetical protein